jgi:hypothetical protein
MTSYPPQCDGVVLRNWDWAEAEGEETSGDTRFGDYHVVGTYDGKGFTLAQPPESPQQRPDPYPDEISTPCEEPEEGWRASDPSKVSRRAHEAAYVAAGREPDYSGGWVDYMVEPVGETGATPDNVILTLAFTGNLARHTEDARELWGGPLCVHQFERTLDELLGILDELSQRGEEIGLLDSGVSETTNQVIAGVIVADDALREEMKTAYGEGTVLLDPGLTPVD